MRLAVPFAEAAARDLIRVGQGASALYNSCSGKHAGFICVCTHRGFDVKGNVEPDHPVQREPCANVHGASHRQRRCATDP